MKCRVAIVIREIHMVQTLSNSDHKSIFSLHIVSQLTLSMSDKRSWRMVWNLHFLICCGITYIRSFTEVVTRVAFSQQTFNFQSHKIWLYERELIHNTYMNYLKESMNRKHNLYICMSFMFICQKKIWNADKLKHLFDKIHWFSLTVKINQLKWASSIR